MKAPKDIIAAIDLYIDGHVYETAERRNFRRRQQQAGELFDNFLIALHELCKTWKFCSDAHAQKGLRDQIIEGLRDADTVEALLKEKDLTLATTIMCCCNCEAAKKHCLDIIEVELGTIRHCSSTRAIPGKIKDLHILWRTMAQSRPPAMSSLQPGVCTLPQSRTFRQSVS